MTMLNRIKEILDQRPDPASGAEQTTPYRFWQETGLGRDTAYRMYNDPTYIPSGSALNKICETYKWQPGEFLYWEPDDLVEETGSEADAQKEPKSGGRQRK